MRILVVEDDECTAKALEEVLGSQHYVVDVADNGLLAWELVEASTYDLILLDIVLPRLDGIELCQKLRSHNYQTPILLLTAQNSSSDKVLGLDAGADDYVVKPFEVKELLARVRVLLRRNSKPIQAVLEWENLRLIPGNCEVTYDGNLLSLTPKEYLLLELFLRNRNIVFSRSDILDRLWSMEEAPKEDTVTAHIKGLRQKLTKAGAPSDFIETVYGLGYRLKGSVNSPLKASVFDPETKKSKTKEQAKELLTQAWGKLKPQNSDRIAALEKIIAALEENSLEEELRVKGYSEAHKLAGGLGIFGFNEGSRLAREIEKILKSEVILDQNEMLHLRDLVKLLRQELDKPAFYQVDLSVQCHDYPAIVAIDDDLQLAKSLLKLASASGIRVKLVRNLIAAKKALTKFKLDVILLNLSFAKANEDCLNFLAQLANTTPPIPVILCTQDDNLSNRVKLSRLVTHVFLQKPLLPEHLLEVVSNFLTQNRSKTGKVMVVDDDPQVLEFLRELLEPCGLKLFTLDEPLWFWDILAENSPDLLILDVEMPHVSGIELCQVVRNEPRWSELPIVFFTVHTDANTMQKAFNAGANECLSKSIVGSELVTHIFNRLERVKLLRTINALAN